LPSLAGIVTTTAALDFETMTVTSFPLQVTVTDGQATATSTVTMTVNNVNEAPIFTSSIYRTNVTDGAVSFDWKLLYHLHRSNVIAQYIYI